jgi:hypothetical protein
MIGSLRWREHAIAGHAAPLASDHDKDFAHGLDLRLAH